MNGLGKTYIGSEKAVSLHKDILVICQKSKVEDWYNHFVDNYGHKCDVQNLTEWKKEDFKRINDFASINDGNLTVFIINYELAWRRGELSKLSDFTLMLDESSLISNPTAKRTKFILNKLDPTNVVLLSGTPTNGKYELLWSQLHLLGWNISKDLYFSQYVEYGTTYDGYPVIIGYKNVKRLKQKMRDYGCVFKKTEEVLNLPEQNFINIKVEESKEYKYFRKNRVIEVEGKRLVGENTLTQLLYERMLCGCYNQNKLDAFKDLIESTEDRVIVFYNFDTELTKLKEVCEDLGKPIAVVNGKVKDLLNYNLKDNCIVLVQYQAGAYGLNLQKANKVIYFTPPLSTELFEQSKKRVHRIGQNQTCFYYELKSGIEYHIYEVLDMRKDYTDELFKEHTNGK